MEKSTDDLKDEVEGQTPARGRWSSRIEFLMSCIGFAVGLGNVWRFPYLAYRNGGGAFLIPYTLMLLFLGIPLFYMEIAFGQFASLGPIAIWNINLMFKGVGFAIVFVGIVATTYYNVIIAHALVFLAASMTSQLPWTHCGNDWNSDHCIESGSILSKDNSSLNGTVSLNAILNETISSTYNLSHVPEATRLSTAAEEYYNNFVLTKSDGIDELGTPSWRLIIALLVSWIIICAVLIKGVNSLGKAVYFTAIFPYVMLTILLVRGLTLEGASQGILYYVKPDFTRLADSRVWLDAATQIFYSTGLGGGNLITVASFNSFHQNCYQDSMIVATINSLTSVFAGFVIFSVLGFIAHIKQANIKDVVSAGPGLAFVVYPEALSQLPIAPMWSVFFFIMLATLGFGSMFTMAENVLSSISDLFPKQLRTRKNSILFRIGGCFVFFLLGIPMLCDGGIYLLNLLDYSIAGFPLIIIILFEIIQIAHIYDYDRFACDIEMMLGSKPGIWWKICWKFICPVLIIVILLFSIIQFKPPSYKEDDGSVYHYPGWAQAVSFMVMLPPLLVIPGWFLFRFFRHGGCSLLRRLNRPSKVWGPAKQEDRENSIYQCYTDCSISKLNDNSKDF